MPDPKELVKKALQGSGRIIFMTGAGVSAESGIPTFRGADGYWTIGSRNYRSEELATRSAFHRWPDEIWAWYLHRQAICAQAGPNPGHLGLADLEARLQNRFLLITQNVDGLHLRAGNTLGRTYQIHGNINYMRCSLECGAVPVPIPDGAKAVPERAPLGSSTIEALSCEECGARTRPHVLWFDECYDEANFRFESSLAAASDCALLVTAGSSGATNLPNQIAQLAAQTGAFLIDVNPEENPFSEWAQRNGGMWMPHKAATGLPLLVDALRA